MAVDDSAKAVEDQVAAAVQAWRDDHEEVLVKSKRFAKKNFEDLKTLMPQLVSAILKKKDERSGRMTQAEVNKFVASRLSKIFYRDKNVLSEIDFLDDFGQKRLRQTF